MSTYLVDKSIDRTGATREVLSEVRGLLKATTKCKSIDANQTIYTNGWVQCLVL